MFLSLSSFLAFKEKKEQILFQMNFLKMSNNIFVCAVFSPLLGILGVFWFLVKPCAKWKSNRSKYNFGFGVP